MDKETARKVAKAMSDAGYHAAAENFVSERAHLYNDWQSKRIASVWLS